MTYMYVDQFSVQSSQRAIQARHSLHSIHAIWGQLAQQRTWIIQSRSAGDVAMAYWSCDSLKVPGFVIHISFVNGIFVYSVYGQTEFPFRKPFETEFTIFPNGEGNFLKRKIITPTDPYVVSVLRLLRGKLLATFRQLGHIETQKWINTKFSEWMANNQTWVQLIASGTWMSILKALCNIVEAPF